MTNSPDRNNSELVTEAEDIVRFIQSQQFEIPQSTLIFEIETQIKKLVRLAQIRAELAKHISQQELNQLIPTQFSTYTFSDIGHYTVTFKFNAQTSSYQRTYST